MEKYKYEDLLKPIDIIPGDSSNYQYVEASIPVWTIVANTPDRLNFGFVLSPINKFHIALNSSLLFRNKTLWIRMNYP